MFSVWWVGTGIQGPGSVRTKVDLWIPGLERISKAPVEIMECTYSLEHILKPCGYGCPFHGNQLCGQVCQ